MKRARMPSAKGRGWVLGLRSFEVISAVEGVRLTLDMKRDLRLFEKRGMTSDERTRFIAAKYGKASV